MTHADETLIGEGVVLDTASATFGARAAGALLDGVIIAAVWLATFALIVTPLQTALDYAAWFALALSHGIGCFIGIPVLVETLTRGRSVGKLALGIRIVRDDGGPIAFRQAFTRGLLSFFELWATVGAIAMLASVMNQRGKRIGDMMAGTYALQVRAAKSHHQPLVISPLLADWASSVDIRRLPDGLALTTRQFLTRAADLHPTSRQDIGHSLADQVAPFVSPPPPDGTHPEVFLSAVLAVRRDREYAIAVNNMKADADAAERIHALPMGVPEAR